jgi:hypothetical protein
MPWCRATKWSIGQVKFVENWTGVGDVAFFQ